jgi:hypothetical protein
VALDGAEARRVGGEGLGGRLDGGARREGEPGEERDAGDDTRLAGEGEVVAGAQVDVAEAAAQLGRARYMSARLDKGQEQRGLRAPEEAHRREQILLEVELGGAGGRCPVAAGRIVGADHARHALLDADEGVLVEGEPRRSDGARPRAAGLGPRAQAEGADRQRRGAREELSSGHAAVSS